MKTYLGDSVYAIYEDGYIILRLNDHRNTEGQIMLDYSVLGALIEFIKKAKGESNG